MSYLVFARKWRPLEFEDVVGQSHITRTLKQAIEKNRIAHAYIFSGTRGVGKTTTARIFSRALNCDNGGPTPTPCGECASCKAIINGSSMDVLEIDGASNNSVDDVRELRTNVVYSSMTGKYKIIIIDEVHMLSKGAFNALLKILEEPPSNVVFIFATTEPQKIPDTIHSRCQRYDFRRISPDDITNHLANICKRENIEFERSALDLITTSADGSMRDALSLLDQVFAFCGENITEKETRQILGLVETEIYGNICNAFLDKDAKTVLETIKDVLSRGFDLSEFIQGFQDYIRNLLLAKIYSSTSNQVSESAQEHYLSMSAKFSEGDLIRFADILKKTENELRWSHFPRFLVEVSLLKMTYLDSTISLKSLLDSISEKNILSLDEKKKDNLKQNNTLQESESNKLTSDTITFTDSTSDFDNTNSEETDKRDIISIWSDFIGEISKKRVTLGTFLSMGNIKSYNDHSVDIFFPKNYLFQYEELKKISNKKFLEEELAKLTGKKYEIHILLDKNKLPDEENDFSKDEIKSANKSIETEIENEPIIKDIIDIFDGEII